MKNYLKTKKENKSPQILKFKAFLPSEESIKVVERGILDLTPENVQMKKWHDNYIEKNKNRIAVDLDIIKKNVGSNSKILEIGSIPLMLTSALKISGYKVLGCDLCPERYSETISKLSVDVFSCDIENERLPFEDNSFGAIVFNEIFEHLRINPIFTMSEVHRVLKPEGYLFLSSPNFRSIKSLLRLLIKNKSAVSVFKEYKKIEEIGHAGHVREYTTSDLTDFLQEVGFVVSEIIYRGWYDRTIYKIIVSIFACLSPSVSYVAYKKA